MFVIPVEKKGKYKDSLSLRFLCFDPATRMAYLSDKGAKVRQWKHRMRVYAVMPKCLQSTEPVDFRRWNFEAKELLSFTLAGITHHRLDSRNPADQRELQRLPQLLNQTYQDSSPSIRPTTTTAAESSAMYLPVVEQQSPIEDANFFAKDREDWHLRCPYYNAAHDMITLVRDTLIADGLRYPIYGGLRNGLDPRNGLQLANFPLYLQHNFRQLSGAVVYGCVHGKMIGCDPHGHLGVCMRHVYLCITDQDVLFVAENGCVARSIPLTHLQAVEHNSPPVTAAANAAAVDASSSSAAAARSSPRASPVTSAKTPYVVFLSLSPAADVLLVPCSAFPAESEDCSASMAAAMPRMNVAREVAGVVRILNTLMRKHGQDATSTSAAATPSRNEGSTRDTWNSNGSRKDDSAVASDLAGTSGGEGGATSLADPAALPSGFSVVSLDPSGTVQDYTDAFEATHGRPFRWQPLPGERRLTPTVQSAAFVALSLGRRPPARQAITKREEFLPFYYGSAAAARAAQEMAAAAYEERQGRTGAAAAGAEDTVYTEDFFAPTVPVRRASKIIDMFKPEQDIY